MSEWVEVSVTVGADAADALGHHFRERGATGVLEEEAPGGKTRVVAWLPAGSDLEVIRAETGGFLESLDEIFPGSHGLPVGVMRVADQDWAESWKEGFDPVEAGTRLRVRTPWTPPGHDDRLEVEILPAMAFGTGKHVSTHGCLVALDALAGERGGLPVVLDVGTGSGVLAFAAVRLGAPRALAIDDDPVAIEAALENRDRNRLGASVELRTATLADGEDRQFGLVIANLFRNILCELAGEITRVAVPDAVLVVAGFLDEDAADVSRAFEARGWRESECQSLEGWMTMTLLRGGGCIAF